MRILLIATLIALALNASAQGVTPDSGFTSKAEAKNLIVNGKKEGKWVEYSKYVQGPATTDTNAPYYCLTIYKEDKPDGVVHAYDNLGRLFATIPYSNFKKNGVEKVYFTNGKLNAEIPYIDDKINGLSVTYWLNGILWKEMPYTNDKYNGEFKEYWGNGKPMRMTSYKDGKLDGSDMVYNFLGKLYREETYVNGVKVATKNYDETSTQGAIGLNYSDSLLATFYNKVLEVTFHHLGSGKTNSYFVKTDFDTSRLTKRIGFDKITFYKNDSCLRSLLLRPWKKNNGRVIYAMGHTIYDKDTIDIELNTITIESVTKKNISLEISCGGGLGYIPTARFIFDKANRGWKYVSEQELLDGK